MGENKVFVNALISEHQGDVCACATVHTFGGEVQQEELTT